jgi:dCMP deaminase
MTRISRDEWGLRLAEVVALRATCLRRSVGCVLMDRDGYILSTGFNGRAAGLPHCNEGFISFDAAVKVSIDEYYTPYTCPGAASPSGTDLDSCEALHAEQNSLLRCRDVREIYTCFVTVSPCITCVKLLLNTSTERIVFRAPYAHDEAARKLWGRDWKMIAPGGE